MSKLMSAEFQQLRIRVNSIAPGYFPSEMTAKESSLEKKTKDTGGSKAAAVAFLTKNSYVNGQILTVDGGVLNVVSS